MKKLLSILLLTTLSMALFGENLINAENLSANKRVESKSFDGKKAVGTFKLGLVGGYPSGVTAGLRTSDVFELNAVVATNFLDFTFGASALFTIVDINIADQIFPLSIGPAVNFNIPFVANYGNFLIVNRYFNMNILGKVRWEYTFENVPINLFIEGGLGVNLEFESILPVKFGYSAATGVRYVF